MQLQRFALRAIFLTAAALATFGADAPKPKLLTLTSPDFTDGGKLPAAYTCDGDADSPPLKWSDAPAGTKSFAIVMHHIPGPGEEHVYLLLYNIKSETTELSKNATDTGTFGLNTVNEKPEYTPPCSKGPGPKEYTLTLYALSDTLKFDKPVTRTMLLAAIKDKTLGSSAITVTYSRPEKVAGADPKAAQGDPAKPDADHPHRGPGGPPELQRALKSLTLTADQKTKVDAALEKFHQAQDQARKDLLKQLKETLDAKQYVQVESSFKQPPPPPPDGKDGPPAPPK